jgi:hypothetical protein
MELAKQLALFLDNRPGMLARVCGALSAAKINIYAISTSDTVDHIVVRMIVSDTSKALDVFEEHGTLVVTADVLLIEGTNKPGYLAEIAQKLADAKINIDYIYSTTSPHAQKGLMILRTSNPKKALKILNCVAGLFVAWAQRRIEPWERVLQSQVLSWAKIKPPRIPESAAGATADQNNRS